MKITVIIAAAGLSRRMGQNKQFLEINGIPVLARTLQLFSQIPETEKIIVTMHESDITRCKHEIIDKYGFSAFLIPGGKERQDSVYNASLYIPESSDIIAVHDGARCFADLGLINRVLAAADQYSCAIPVVPCKDTIKIVENNRIVNTPDRASLCAVQTPQCFKQELFIKMYKNAYAKNFFGTDDASLAEHMGVFPVTVPGDFKNIKVTTPEDIALAELYAKEYHEN